MAKTGILGDLLVRIVGDKTLLDKALADSEARAKTTEVRINESFAKIGDGFSKVGRALTVGVTAPLVGLGVAAVKSLGQFQLYQASFETMLGSAAMANTVMGDLQKKAAVTPFTFEDLADSTKTMLQFNIGLKETGPLMDAIGNIAGGSSDKFRSLTLAFSQSQSAGRLMGQDLLQMINSGFNPLQVISKKTGETMAELKTRMEEGAISALEVSDAFKSAAAAGGLFFGGMERGSKTIPGLFSTLTDNVGAMGRSFASVLAPAIEKYITQASSMALQIAKLDPQTKQFILTMGAFAAAAGPVALGISLIIKAFIAMNPVVLAITVGLTGVVAIMAAVGANAAQAKRELDAFSKALKGASDVETLDLAIKLLDERIKKTKALKKASMMGDNETDKSRKYEEELNGLLSQRTGFVKSLNAAYMIMDKDRSAAAPEAEAATERTKKDAAALAIINGIEGSINSKLAEGARLQTLFGEGGYDAAGAAKMIKEEILNAVEGSKGLVTLNNPLLQKYIEFYNTWKDLSNSVGYVGDATKEQEKTFEQLNNEANEWVDKYIRGNTAVTERNILLRDQAKITAKDNDDAYWKKLMDDADKYAKSRTAWNSPPSPEVSKGINDLSAAWSLAKGSLGAYGDLVANQGAAEIAAMKERGASEEEIKKKQNEINEKAFNAHKAQALAEVVINGAVAASRVWGQTGIFGMAAQIPVIAMTAIQSGLIAAQQYVPSLASGGVASSPTLAQIGDNSLYPEMVAPLSPSFFANIGDGILGALAARSSQAPGAGGGRPGGAAGLGMSSSDLDGFAAKVAARITVVNYTDLDGKRIAASTSRYQDNNQVGRR
jgi:tape measure domain-containing protein